MSQNVRIERERGRVSSAYLPAEKEPVKFDVYGAVAEHCGDRADDGRRPHATTLDYVVAAAGGWLVGTFRCVLEARKINASNKHLTAEVTGEIELEGNVLVIRRIHVVYHLNAPEEARETIERIHKMHSEHCPVYRSLYKSIDITTEYQLQ